MSEYSKVGEYNLVEAQPKVNSTQQKGKRKTLKLAGDLVLA